MQYIRGWVFAASDDFDFQQSFFDYVSYLPRI